MQEELQLKLLPITLGLRLYHRHEVHGLDNIPKSGPVIIACNHSLATYDISLLMTAVYQKLNRFPRALIDRAFYKIPGLGELMEKLGCIVGSPENAQSLLSNGELLYLAPGGMQEMFLFSQRVDPAILRLRGFEWRYSRLEPALAAVLGEGEPATGD